jgi:hypothetical protein
VAYGAAPYGAQLEVGRRWNLRQPFYSSLDPLYEVRRRFLKLDAFHDQVHGILMDKVMYDLSNAWRFWRLRPLCTAKEIFLGHELGLKILCGPILHEVVRPDENASSIVIIPPVSFLV